MVLLRLVGQARKYRRVLIRKLLPLFFHPPFKRWCVPKENTVEEWPSVQAGGGGQVTVCDGAAEFSDVAR
jgi:hypothetical protein